MFVNENDNDRSRLLAEVDLTRERIKSAENMLNYTYEPELVESAILEIESARKRYNYLLKKIKQYSSEEL